MGDGQGASFPAPTAPLAGIRAGSATPPWQKLQQEESTSEGHRHGRDVFGGVGN